MPMANSPPLSLQHHERERPGQHADDERAEEQRRIDADAEVGEADRGIGAEAEERLLADRHQAAEPDQRVPHHREDDVDEQRRELVDGVGAEERRPDREHGDDDGGGGDRDARLGRPAFDDGAGSRSCSRPPPKRGPDALAEVAEEQPREQDGEKGDVAGDEEALRVDERAETLRDAEHDAADERAPQRSGPADHRRLEGEDELRRAGVRVERRAHAEERAGDRDRRHGDRGGDRIDAPRVDADEADRVGVLRGRADRAARSACG